MPTLLLQKVNDDGTVEFIPWSAVDTSSGGTGGNVVVESRPNREIIEVHANGNTYYGSAPYGSATSDAVWAIERESNNDWVTSAPNQIWDDRLTVVYNNGVA